MIVARLHASIFGWLYLYILSFPILEEPSYPSQLLNPDTNVMLLWSYINAWSKAEGRLMPERVSRTNPLNGRHSLHNTILLLHNCLNVYIDTRRSGLTQHKFRCCYQRHAISTKVYSKMWVVWTFSPATHPSVDAHTAWVVFLESSLLLLHAQITVDAWQFNACRPKTTLYPFSQSSVDQNIKYQAHPLVPPGTEAWDDLVDQATVCHRPFFEKSL